MFKMLIGMSFISVAVNFLLSESHYQKYIKVILGLFTVTIIIQGISGIKDIRLDSSIIDEIERKAEINSSIATEDIKNVMLENVKSNITNRLNEENIKVKELEINIDENFNITVLVIRLENKLHNDRVVDILTNEFYIDKNVIETG